MVKQNISGSSVIPTNEIFNETYNSMRTFHSNICVKHLLPVHVIRDTTIPSYHNAISSLKEGILNWQDVLKTILRHCLNSIQYWPELLVFG